MQEISGYPDVGTVGIKTWTNATRPNKSINDNYLLGYNTDIGSLEIVSKSGSVTPMFGDSEKKSIALLFYPVGSYYFTSDNSFNPNNTWGGTWERLKDGRVLIAESPTLSIGKTGGVETVTLNQKQIPNHAHPHTHTKGTMNIVGTFAGSYDNRRADNKEVFSGAFSQVDGTHRGSNDADKSIAATVLFDASAPNAWTGSTSKDETKTGGGEPHDNMQPYRVCAIWHRTA